MRSQHRTTKRPETAEEAISRADLALRRAMEAKPVYLPAYERQRRRLLWFVLLAAFLVGVLVWKFLL